MAWYRHDKYVRKSDSSEYDKEHAPGTSAPHSGIYRCAVCGKEIVSNEGKQLPPLNHHQHGQNQGAILWQLVVYADHNPK